MGFLDRVRSSLAWTGTSGRPRSGNGASSFHLFWDVPPGPWVEASAVLEVTVPPSVRKLYFWALQVTFEERGRSGGGAHLGLQWHGQHPGGTAVNWGGYGPGGGELSGSTSALPSGTGNVNTRDYPWVPARPYRLRVHRAQERGPDGIDAWRGEVTDLATGETTVVRDLWAAGTELSGFMVWSEVFADCDEPSSTVRWRDLEVRAGDGRVATATSARVNYQAIGDGGCRTTDTRATAAGFEQVTGTARQTPQGAQLRLPAG